MFSIAFVYLYINKILINSLTEKPVNTQCTQKTIYICYINNIYIVQKGL